MNKFLFQKLLDERLLGDTRTRHRPCFFCTLLSPPSFRIGRTHNRGRTKKLLLGAGRRGSWFACYARPVGKLKTEDEDFKVSNSVHKSVNHPTLQTLRNISPSTPNAKGGSLARRLWPNVGPIEDTSRDWKSRFLHHHITRSFFFFCVQAYPVSISSSPLFQLSLFFTLLIFSPTPHPLHLAKYIWTDQSPFTLIPSEDPTHNALQPATSIVPLGAR